MRSVPHGDSWYHSQARMVGLFQFLQQSLIKVKIHVHYDYNFVHVVLSFLMCSRNNNNNNYNNKLFIIIILMEEIKWFSGKSSE